jgi:hypothetical protein
MVRFLEKFPVEIESVLKESAGFQSTIDNRQSTIDKRQTSNVKRQTSSRGDLMKIVDDVTEPGSCCGSGVEVVVGEKSTDERTAI